MTDDTIDPTTNDATVRVTYAELAAARGVSIAAARRLTLRHRWPKQIGNDGLTRVVVPVAFVEDVSRVLTPSLDEVTIAAIAEAATVAMTDALTEVVTVASTLDETSVSAIAKATTVAMTDAMTDTLNGMASVVPTLQEAITSLRVQLETANERADRAEGRIRELQDQLARRSWWPWRRRGLSP